MLPLLPMIAGAAAGQIANSAIGQPFEWLENLFNPAIITSPVPANDNSFAAFVSGQYHFNVQVLAPSDADIQGLDDFFESYGYNVSRFQVPNLKVRGNFTYVKTRDAVVKSSNYLAAQQMAAMLNNGCKFWVGDIG